MESTYILLLRKESRRFFWRNVDSAEGPCKCVNIGITRLYEMPRDFS